MSSDRTRRLVEAAGATAFGALLAGGSGSLIAATMPAAVIGGLNGAITGWRRIYDWRHGRGVVAFVLDSTWALTMTSAALFANTIGLVQRDSGYVPELSERHNRQVYRRGFVPRKGFAVTVGNVIGGAGEIEHPRRARLVTDHEDVHVWQARWFGPLFPPLYVGWMVIGGAVGAVVWLVRRRRSTDGLGRTIESTAYYLNPFEWWAYSRDDHWPPTGKVNGLGWRRPCCQPLTSARPHRPSGVAQFRS